MLPTIGPWFLLLKERVAFRPPISTFSQVPSSFLVSSTVALAVRVAIMHSWLWGKRCFDGLLEAIESEYHAGAFAAFAHRDVDVSRPFFGGVGVYPAHHLVAGQFGKNGGAALRDTAAACPNVNNVKDVVVYDQPKLDFIAAKLADLRRPVRIALVPESKEILVPIGQEAVGV
jgi:hypothetical protein